MREYYPHFHHLCGECGVLNAIVSDQEFDDQAGTEIAYFQWQGVSLADELGLMLIDNDRGAVVESGDFESFVAVGARVEVLVSRRQTS